MTLIERLLEQAGQRPDSPAVADERQSFSFGQLAAASLATGQRLRRLTDRPHVGIALPSCAAFPCAFFGILATDKAAVPINLLFSPRMIGRVVKEAGVDTIITSKLVGRMLEPLGVTMLFVEEFAESAASIDAGQALSGFRTTAEPDDTAMIIYTSGSSGDPKGVILTQKNLLRNVDSSAERYDYGEGDVTLGVLPLFHAFAATCTMLLPLLNGGQVVYQPKFVPQKIVEAIGRDRVTALFAVPSMFRLLLRASEGERPDFSSLRYCVAGGEPLPEAVARDFEQTFGVPLLEGYGMTEASPVVAFNPAEAPRPKSVGLPLSWAEIRLMAGEATPAATGGEGEIWIRGDCVMKGYHNDPAATAEAITPDGWLRTGDIGRLDEAGYLYITGRMKELIISGGENISPVEIEDAISEHPAVAEVGVVPAPDEARGEVPRAFVVLREGVECTEKEILDHCRQRLARVKWPRAVTFIEEMPHTPSGKVLRRKLKEI